MKKYIIILIIVILGILVLRGLIHKDNKTLNSTPTPTSTPVLTQTPDEIIITGTITEVQNFQPFDGDLRVLVDGKWVIIGGGRGVGNNNGVWVGFDTSVPMENNKGSKVEIFAKKNEYVENGYTILGDSKYYIKIIKN